MDIITVLFVIVMTLVLLDYLIKPKLNLPCPKRFPIIGNILAIGKNPLITFSEWTEKYGPIFTIQLVSEKFVVLNDYESIYECFVRKGADFAGRPKLFRTHFLLKSIDITFQDYTQAQKLMKMKVQTLLKQYDKGIRYIENIVLDVSKECVHTLLNGKSENVIDPSQHIYLAICKSLSLLLTGEKYEDNHHILQKWIKTEKLISENLSLKKGFELDVFPWLHLFNTQNFQNLASISIAIDEIFEFLKVEYNNIVAEEKKETVAFRLLDNLEKEQDEGFNEERVKFALLDIISAGTSTSSASLYLIILILACYPDMQQKIYVEVQALLNDKDRDRICLEDKNRMPYTRAFLFEIQRYGSIVPLSITHTARVDTELMGKHIPKGTMLIPNLWNLHHSTQYWEDPWSFRPERFLNPDGSLIALDHYNMIHLMPFGAGPRVCLGQSLAKARLFLFLTTIVQETCIEPVPGIDVKPDARDFQFKLVIRPDPYMVKFIKRV